MWKETILLIYLLILAVFDLKEKRVPLWGLVIGMLVAGGAVVYGNWFGQESWIRTLLGIIPGILLLAVSFMTGKAGYADGVVLLIVGMVEDYKVSLFVLCMGLFLASMVSVMMLVLRKANRQTRIPFIPFLAVALWMWEVLM